MQSICDYTSSGSEDEGSEKISPRESEKADLRGGRKRGFTDINNAGQTQKETKGRERIATASVLVSHTAVACRLSKDGTSVSAISGSEVNKTDHDSNSRNSEGAPVGKIRRYVSKRERRLQEQRLEAEQKRTEPAKETALQLSLQEPTSTPLIPSKNAPPKRVRVRLDGHTNCVNAVRWSKRHPFLLASCAMDHRVKLWNVYQSNSCVRTLDCHQHAVKDLQWTLGGRHGLSCGYDKTVRLWDAEKGQELQQFKHSEYVTAVQIHPTDSNIFLSGTYSTGIFSWDIRSNQLISRYEAPFGQVQDLAFINDNEFISTAEVTRRNSVDKGIMVWDLKTTAILSNQIYQEAYTCTSLRVHPHENVFLAQSSAEYIAIFSTQRPYKLNKYKRFEGHKASGYWVGFDVSPDGSVVGSGSSDGRVLFYNYQTSRIIASLQSDSTSWSGLAFHPVLPSTVATCSWDGHILIWE